MKRMFIWLIALMFFGSSFAYAANEYTNSAHGNTGYGVDRKAPFPAYAVGNCAHCHEQHASIGGAEPAPSAGDAAGPDDYLLFDASHTSQTADFCFDCHVSSSSQQDGAYIYNYTYARRAGNYSDGLIGIKEAFDTGNASYHDLDNIVTFITGKWGYTANSNPCCGCHNPHAAQGDPSGDANVAKSSSTRGYPVSLPSAHATLTTWGLWGDEDGEKMDDYTSNYQAPYRPGDTTYEPDGTSTTTGSNLTDFVTFCLDCHENEVTSSSTTSLNPGTTSGKLTAIDWSSDGEKHGQRDADNYISVNAPYTAGAGALGYVLSCLDCHEPHGSSNKFLIREEVNGVAVGDNAFITVSSEDCDPASRYTDNADDWKTLCSRCHDVDYEDIHHLISTDKPYDPVNCSSCHEGPSQQPINCSCCHYHGSSAAGMVTF